MLYTSVERMIAQLESEGFYKTKPDAAAVKKQFLQAADEARKTISMRGHPFIYFASVYDEDGELVCRDLDCLLTGVALAPTGETVFITPLGPIMLMDD